MSLDLKALKANRNIEARNYWKDRLGGLEFSAYFSGNDPATATQEAAYAQCRVSAGEEVYSALKAIAGTDKARHMILLAALGIYIQKYTALRDVCVFIPWPSADGQPAGAALIPFRMQVQGGLSFKGLLKSVKEQLSADLRYGNYPPEMMLGVPPGELAHIPATGMLPEGVDSALLNRLSPEFLFSFSTAGSLVLTLQYKTGAAGDECLPELAEPYFALLHKLMRHPDEQIDHIELISPAEKEKVLHAFNDTAVPRAPGQTLLSLLEEQVVKYAENIAVKTGHALFTYTALNGEAEKIAAYLQQVKQVRAGDLVGLMLQRDEYLLPAIFGILKAGAAYVPIDPAYPPEWINAIVEDAKLRVMLSRKEYMAMPLPAGTELADLQDALTAAAGPYEGPSGRKLSDEDLAYVIYTSGTTGKPKGVMIEHRSVINLLKDLQERYPLGETDAYLLKTSCSFDVSVTEIYGWLLGGGSVFVLQQGLEADASGIMDAVKTGGVTHINFVPAMFDVFTETLQKGEKEKIAGLRYIMLAGEALPPGLVKKFKGLQLPASLENIYGPTEATVYSSAFSLAKGVDAGIIPIGKPLSNTKLYIINPQYQLQPPGVPGELCIAGTGLARGYLNNEDLTNEKFIDNPFAPGEKLYRTGDLARWLPDGNIVFLGRTDYQVKVRGYRIELWEIERQLAKYPQLQSCLVAVKEKEGEKVLVAYYLSERQVPPEELRNFLAARLPAYMVPAWFLQLEAFPLSRSGKIDRQRLPEPGIKTNRPYVAPANELERRLLAIWAEVLRLDKDQISTTDSFFELGGNSLRAMVLVNKIQGSLGMDIAIRDIFDRETIRSLGDVLNNSGKSDYVPLKKAEEREYYELSVAQLRLHYLYESDRSSLTFNVPLVISLHGRLDKERLRQAFNALVKRHDAFRTSIRVVNDRPVQLIAEALDFEVAYFQSFNADPQPVIDAFIRPFDLSLAPLFRVGLIETAPDVHLLMTDMHHIIADGTSVGLIINDFMELYNNTELPPLQLDYKDYATWQQTAAYQERIARQKEFWVNEFSTPITPLDIPVDFLRKHNTEGDWIRFQLDREETARLREIAREETATISMVILSVLSILLNKLSGQEDIVLGMAVAGREQMELDRMIGMFPLVLPLRTYPEADLSFRDFLARLKSTFLSTFDNQSYQYEDLAKELNMERVSDRNPWFDVMFLYQNFETAELSIPGLTIAPYKEQNVVAHEKLNLTVAENEFHINLRLVYAIALFRRETAEKFVQYFRNIVHAIMRDTSAKIADIDLLADDDRKALTGAQAFNRVPLSREKAYWDLFEEQVAKTPLRTAVKHNGASLSYRELHDRALRFAATLSAKGLRRGMHVALFLPRGIDMLTAILAIFRSGAAYVPIDTEYPEQRIADILSDSGSPILITLSGEYNTLAGLRPAIPSLKEVLLMDVPAEEMEVPLAERSADDLAYIIYTSGTTGRPKGAMVHQLGMINHMQAFISILEMGEGDIMAQTASPCFDISVWQFLAALVVGGSTCIIDSRNMLDAQLLTESLHKEQVTVFQTVPSLLSTLLDELPADKDALLSGLKWVVATGETLSVALVNKWYSLVSGIRLLNAYGPTEASDDITAHIVPPPAPEQFTIPVGRPLQNLQIYILDNALKLCPLGVKGEICVAGIGVGRGYWKDEEKTRRSFIPNPFVNPEEEPDYAVIYRTGDLGYISADGNVVCMGRKDDQVKVRGFRIELGEVENGMLQYTPVRQAAVIVKDNGAEKILVAYYVPETDLTPQELKQLLLEKLPQYMVPSYFVKMDNLPLTANGKLNRKALPMPDIDDAEGFVPPVSDTEKTLVEIWAGILDMDAQKISIEKSFFELGGNSLKILKLKSLINKRLQWQLSIADLFRYPTITSLVDFVNSSQPGNETRKQEMMQEVSEMHLLINNLA
jgi:amino acid adenylation domain-containing protein